ncbi:MAG: T9SS type A sorting domain-containing protein [Paludibacter sp.]
MGQIGTITVSGTKGALIATCSNWNYNLATATSGEIVVLVNWTAVSNHLTTGVTAQEVAAAIAPKIYQSQNAQPALSELPIHLMGHSRGGGMAYEIARLLGLQGIEVEQVTSLDPHPLTATDPQGAAVPIGPGSTIDTPVQIYQNILFADNYYQNIAYPTGLSLTGAYNRLWTSLPGGYHNQTGYTYNILGSNFNFSDHLNIILAYHGTIDLATPVSNGQANMTATERTWFNTYENTGQNTGFVYSRDIAGNRKSTDIPNSGNAIIAGYNNNSTLGGSGARATLTWTTAVWPNVITSVAIKSAVELSAGTQTLFNNDALQINYTYRSYTNASAVSFYLDIDRNPYNNNNSATIGTQNFSATAASIVQSTLAWTVSGLTSGTKYYVYAKISDGTHTRYQYLDYEFSMACIVNIPDTNFKAALLAISGLDANNNGNIECSEATAWTGSIDVSAKSISDLTGIASFTNITELNCGDNQLTSLNISSNTALIGLSCYGNNLTSLNVNSLTSLTGLSCSFNQLTSLDLSSNTVLRNLYCSDNSITTLNVSANASLKSIYCDNNLLTSLNVQNGNNHYFDDFNASSNTGLTCIQVDNVAWSNANWTHKDAGASFSTNCTPPCTNPAISSQSTATQTQCLNGTFTPITVTATGTNLSYQWYSNTTATTTGGTTIGTNSDSYTPLATTVGTLYYYCEVSGDCGTTQTSTISGAFIVNSLPSAPTNTTPTANQTINSGHSTILSASGTGTLGWYSAATGGVYLGGGANYTTPVLTANTTYYVQDSTTCGASATRTPIAVQVVCIVNIPDINFKAALLAISGLDANSDGEIQCAEASSYSGTINVSNQSISDLTGISAFTNIPSINCSGNSLTTLDFSSNTAMEFINCQNNTLTSINVSGVSSLIDFNCSNNQLTALDVSGNSNLENLYCYSNSITTLSFPGGFGLDGIDCHNNQLTSLDVSLTTALTYLFCQNNTLTSLNLKNGNNTNMYPINATNNPGLTCIQVDNAAWSTANWTQIDPGASFSTNCSCINPTISSQSTASQTQCLNGTFTPITVTATGTNLSYQWYSNTTATTTGGTTIGTNSDSYTPLATTVGTLYYYCEVSGDCGTTQTSAVSGAFIVNTIPNTPTNTTPLANQTINSGHSTILSASGIGTLGWYSASTGGVWLGGGANLTTPVLTTNTTYYVQDSTTCGVSATRTAIAVEVVCIVNIPDANFKTALLANVTINTNNDGEIQCSEATAYTGTINVDAKGIADLSGIESFTNITNLICSNNSLTSLNVSGLTSLNELACNINQLANLNLSSNTALTKLNCSSNALTSLNVSGLTLLVDLYCFNNQLTNLNVLSNASIGVLECDQNLLTSLDVTGLTSLYYLTCYNNQLTTLDFSSNTLLSGLYCNDNLLTSLNLKNGNNTILPGWDFDATNNPSLSCIQVDNAAYSTTNWTQIDAGASFSTNCTPCIVNILDANFKAALLADVTINTNNDGEIQCSEASAYTGQLDVGSQNINNLTGIEAFTNITYLSCNPNNLTALDVSANTLLTYLDCSSNSLTSLDLTANTALQELYCKFNSLTSLNVTGLTSLNHIDCISNLYTSLSFISNTNLQYLNCESNSLTSLNVAGLTSLTYLDCSNNQLTSLAVSSNTALQILYCRNNLLSSLNVSGLTALSDFDCSYNQLTNLNISSNTNLFEIHCESNLLTSMNVSGLSSLSNLVCNDNQLTAIDVSSNTTLSGLICRNNLLTSLNVKNGNNIYFESIDTRNNPNLTCIQVDNEAYSTANWTFKDAGASYSTNCANLFTWIGNISNAWSQGANWSTGTVPTSSDNIVIPSATAYSPIVDLNTASAAVCNDLTINSAAVLTIAATKALTVNGIIYNNAGNSGIVIKSDSTGTGSLLHSTASVNAIVERYIPHSTADEFHMLASPVATQAISPVFNEPDGFFVWNEPNGNWIEYADVANFAAANGGTNFIPAKGYAVSYPGTTTKNFIGNLNQGIISIPLTVTTAIADSGWNFVANPYPSAIDWDAMNGWTKSSLLDTNGTSINGKTAMWIWNSLKGNYGAYNSNNSGGIGTNGVSNNIAIGQGFWVKAATTGTLIMNDSVRVHSSQAYLKATLSDIIRLAVTGTVNNYSDEIVVKYGNANDLGGAEKMFSLEATAPSLYSSKLNKKWSINYLTSITANSVIPVGFKAAIDGNYTINASELNSFSNLTYVYLKDLTNNILIDLKQTATYTFASTTSDNPNRFQLIFALSPLGISDNVIQNTSIYANDNNIYINSNENILQIAVYNTIGQLIKTIENANNGNIVVNMADKTTAYYIVRVITGKNTYSAKVLIR